MDKEDLVLNNLKWLICHKSKANQTKYSIVTWWFKKFRLGFKNNDYSPKTVDTEAVLQAVETNPIISTWWVSGKLNIL